MAKRLAGNPAISPEKREAYAGDRKPILDTHELMKPLSKRKPATIAVNFMGDLFFERVNKRDIWPVFNIIQLAEIHVFFTLTKRIGRMHRFMTRDWPEINGPLPKNIYHGLTVCTQKEADEKIPLLIQIPGYRWISIEPMLEHISINQYLHMIDFVVAGCESGPGRRPSRMEWFRDMRDQCHNAGITFYIKQTDVGLIGVTELPYGPENVPPMPDGLK